MGNEYHCLKFGEVIQKGDEVEMSNSFHDPAKWEKTRMVLVGTKAPDPRYPAHRQYRRPLIDGK